jgi:hypothetical protein
MSDINALLADPAVKVTDWNSVIGAQNALITNQNALRDQRAQKAMEDIYKQAFNPLTGQYDQGKINAGIAQSPQALGNARQVIEEGAHAVGAGATTQGTQLENVAKTSKLFGHASAALMVDPSDANLQTQITLLKNEGMDPKKADALYAQLQPMKPGERQSFAYQKNLDNLDAVHQVYGNAPTMTDFGDSKRPVTTLPGAPGRPPSATVGAGTPTTLTPGEKIAQVPVDIPVRADGSVIPRDPATGLPTETPARMIPGKTSAGNLPMPGATGTTNAPGTVSPTFGTGRLNVPPALTNPNKPQGGGGGTTAPAPGATQPPVTTSSMPPDQQGTLDRNVKAYNDDQAAQPDLNTRTQNMAHAYEALQQLKSATGQGAAGINSLRSYLQTAGLLPSGAVTEQQLFEIANKYLTRAMTDAAGGGATDLGRHIAEQSNPGSGLSTGANFALLRNDMGKTMQQMAAYKTHDPKTGGAGYLEHRADVASNTDPRGFVWNMYSKEEQDAIKAEVARDKTGVARKKLATAIGMADVQQLHAPGTGY